MACGTSRDEGVVFESSGAGAGDSAGMSTGAPGRTEESDSGAGDSSVSGSASSSGGSAGSSGGSPSTDTSGASTSEHDPSEESGAMSEGARFDVPSVADTTVSDDGANHADCQKIDFLFSIDNSGSMAKHQTKLTSSFGPFIDTIVNQVTASDYHIMVVDSDGSVGGGSGCETALGAGQVRTCPGPSPTQRFITSSLPPDQLKSSFQCLATVGDKGSPNELPISAAAEAVSTQAMPGACNDGFLRDDAILVVTIISDDFCAVAHADDAFNYGSPDLWWNTILEAKSGQMNNVVVLGLFDGEVTASGWPLCEPARPVRFFEFIDKFGSRGVTGSVNDPDYNKFFQQAVALIDTACQEFVPPE